MTRVYGYSKSLLNEESTETLPSYSQIAHTFPSDPAQVNKGSNPRSLLIIAAPAPVRAVLSTVAVLNDSC
jgi:hypothetical protein